MYCISNVIEPSNNVEMQESSEIQVNEEMEQSSPVQFQHNHTGNLPDNSAQGQTPCSEVLQNTPAPSMPTNQPGNELLNRNKTCDVDLNTIPEARPQLHYRSNNADMQTNNYVPARRFSTLPISPYSITGAQNVCNYEALYGSMNTAHSASDLKSYTQYAAQNTHPYLGRYCPPSMVAGATIYGRNFYPSKNEPYRNQQLGGRTSYDRRLHNCVVSETPHSLLGAL